MSGSRVGLNYKPTLHIDIHSSCRSDQHSSEATRFVSTPAKFRDSSLKSVSKCMFSQSNLRDSALILLIQARLTSDILSRSSIVDLKSRLIALSNSSMVNWKLFSLLLQVRDAVLRSPVTKHCSRSLGTPRYRLLQLVTSCHVYRTL
jgi:hypothetical protein